ncbi:sensor histidine kinase [Halalkalibacter kiskunsagensis]|uniref:Sensor histidine kinase n=1 Tax=Halalkalibacter kiskunsagensis TaxID=1548599 RepID=A0ABV6KAS6_9BACI
MRKILGRLKYSGMFSIMFLITVISIISVTVIITWTTVRMSENFFVETFSITNSKVVNQIKESFESFNYSVVSASNNLLQNNTMKRILTEDYTNAELMRVYYDLNVQMEQIKSTFGAYEVGIMVMGNNGMTYATDHRTFWPITDEELENNVITIATLNEPKWLKYHSYNHKGESVLMEDNYIVASRAFMERMSGNINGVMYFAIKESEFRQFYTGFTSPGNDVFVLNNSSVIVSSNRTELIGEEAEDLLGYAVRLAQESEDHINANFMGDDYIVLSQYLPNYDMYLLNLIDKKTAIGNFIDKKAIFLISMGIVFIALIIVFFISRKMTNSLSNLVKQIENVPKQQFHQYVSVSGMYETKQIGNAFNDMLDELHEYVDQLVLSQKQKRKAELAALQQQINPHFLYNTLASIKFMVQQGDKDDSAKTINALISLLQNTIGQVSETITVNQELDNLKNYVFINQKRYGNRIKVHYFVDPNCVDYRIPKLILQPFVENSFFHAFNHKVEGYINVLIWQEGDMLICEIADNGDGMEVSNESKLPNTKRNQQLFSGIGVRNVHDRIQIIYGEPYSVTITSELGEGTKVRITLPTDEG